MLSAVICGTLNPGFKLSLGSAAVLNQQSSCTGMTESGRGIRQLRGSAVLEAERRERAAGLSGQA